MSHDHASDECADYLERIVYFLDNELDEADCSVVRAHLDTCNPCLARYDLQRTVKSIVARPLVPNPESTAPFAWYRTTAISAYLGAPV